MVEDESGFVVVLIGKSFRFFAGCGGADLGRWNRGADEVESLTAARAGAMSGKEPSDALRASYSRFTARRRR